jgi:hypothetical protein
MTRIRPGGKIPAHMQRKLGVLLLCMAAVVAVALLASSLHDVNLLPGRSFVSGQSPQAPLLIPMIQVSSEIPLWKIILVWLVFVVNFVLFFVLLPRELRKRILRQVLRLMVGALVIVLALRYRLIDIPGVTSEPGSVGSPADRPLAAGEALPVYHPPHVEPWIAYLITLAIVSTVLLLAWVGYRRWMRGRLARSAALSDLGDVAQASLADLAAGRSWADVIIDCYARMSKIVSERRGLQRGSATTPREFADALNRAGLPAYATTQLTTLFESVRYGGRTSSEADRMEAVACLDSILRACGAGS